MSKKTIILFSGDMDKVLAAFVIANGAAAMGDDVTMFFTFWGISALKKQEKRAKAASAGKSLLQRGFSLMLPKGPEKLGMSKMNFGGAGPVMMKKAMKAEKVMSIPELIATAQEQDIKFIACTMSMDVMGIRPEELIDGVEYAGVATYLGEAEEADVNLFI